MVGKKVKINRDVFRWGGMDGIIKRVLPWGNFLVEEITHHVELKLTERDFEICK